MAYMIFNVVMSEHVQSRAKGTNWGAWATTFEKGDSSWWFQQRQSCLDRAAEEGRTKSDLGFLGQSSLCYL